MIEELSLVLPLSRPVETDTSLATLVETYSTLLFRVAHSVLRNPTEAEDAVQDTFVRVLQFHEKAHKRELPAIRDLRVWLVRITWNLALDRRRRVRPDQLDDTFAHALAARNTPADIALDDARELAHVLREIDRLPCAERQVLLLSAIEELDTRELAQVLNKSESAIRALIFRARTRLRDRLQTRLTKGGRA